MRLSPPGGKRQDGIETVQSLDGGLLIHAENDGVRRRVQIEADDVGGLGFKIGVVADHVMAQPMRLETVATPDSGHRHMGGSQPFGQAATAPLGAAVVGATPRPLQNPGLQLGRAFGHGTSLVPGDQPADACRTKPAGPALHIRRTASQIGGGLPQAPATRQCQDDPRPPRIFRPHNTRAHAPLKFPAFWR